MKKTSPYLEGARHVGTVIWISSWSLQKARLRMSARLLVLPIVVVVAVRLLVLVLLLRAPIVEMD
jgi:hypothetical protein